MTKTLLAVFAHPDDESYRAGGTLAMLARGGVDVQVITATSGERGIPGALPSEAKLVREKELRCACKELGILQPRFLDFPDGELSSINNQDAVMRLVLIIRVLRPDLLLTWPPSGISGHKDHRVISDWTRKSFLQAANPAYLSGDLRPFAVPAFYYLALSHSVAEAVGFHDLHSIPDEEVSMSFDARTFWDQKMAAIHCHRSQIGHSPIMKMEQTQQEVFLGKEQFVCVYRGLDDADLFSCLGEAGCG